METPATTDTPDADQLRAFLGRVELFKEVPDEVLEQLVPQFRTQQAAAGAVIVEQGKPGDELFLIDEGRLEVSAEVNGKRVRLGILRAGDFFGEIALLQSTPRVATVTALTTVRLWILSRASLAEAIDRVPALGVKLRNVMRRRELANALRALQ